MASQVFGDRKILLVDDDPAILAVVGEGLRMRGCEVIEAETGEKGIELAGKVGPDLIVLDVLLPDIDGQEVCKRLKEDEATCRTPVIFLSAKDEPKERVQGLRAGAIDYVVKPFDLDELVARIDIGLRVKAALESPAPSGETEGKEDGIAEPKPESLFPAHEFSQVVEERVQRLDPDRGLLTLVYVRIDQEDLLAGKKADRLRGEVFSGIVGILQELVPPATSLGEIDPFQIGALIPRKNKYGAELILDELRNRLRLKLFSADEREFQVTVSCGVAEFPNPLIKTGQELEERAAFALRRAVREGGDQVVLL